MVRAKFVLNSVTKYKNGGGTKLEFSPVFSHDPEHPNKKFWDATPSGLLWMQIKDSKLAEDFVLGGEYFLDFTLAPPIL